jgi:hypothetical protein
VRLLRAQLARFLTSALEKGWPKRLVILVQYVLVVAVLYFLLFGIKGLQWPSASVPSVALSVAFVVLMRLSGVMRFRSLLPARSGHSAASLSSAQLVGASLGLLTPAKMGEAYKVLALGRTAREKKTLTSIFFAEKFMDLAMYVLFGLLAALVNGIFLQETLLLFTLLVVAVWVYARIHGGFAAAAGKYFTTKALFFSLMAFGCLVLSFYFSVASVGISMGVFNAFHIFSTAGVISGLSMLPGGLGGRELTAAFMLGRTTGIPLSEARNTAVFHSVILYTTTFTMGLLAWGAERWAARHGAK